MAASPPPSAEGIDIREGTDASPLTMPNGTPADALISPIPPTAIPTLRQTPEPKSSLGIEPAMLQGQVVQFWHSWTGQAKTEIDALVAQFNNNNEWGTRIEAVSFSDFDELWKQTSNAQAALQAPELVIGYPHQILSFDKNTPVVDLNAYVNDPIWGLTAQDQADFYPVFWQADILEDRRLGIPASRSGQMLYYNNEWASELGFTSPPTNTQEFKEQACAAAQANLLDDDPTNDGTGGLVFSANYLATLGWLEAFGGPVEEANQEGYQFDRPETEAAFTFLRQLYDEGCAWLSESEFTEVEFASREGLFSVGGLSGLQHQELAFTRLENRDAWTVLPFMAPVTGQAIPVYGPSFALLPSNNESQLAAWLFVRWLLQTENAVRFNQATDSFPLRVSTYKSFREYTQQLPQWIEAVNLVTKAFPEPPFASWGQVRWALQDATTQLFRSYFSLPDVPDLVKFLQKTAQNLHEGSLE